RSSSRRSSSRRSSSRRANGSSQEFRAMRGNLGYFVGIDRAANAMHNVSLWETVGDADQMASFQPMLALAGEFIALGVRFQRPILNFSTLWSLRARPGR